MFYNPRYFLPLFEGQRGTFFFCPMKGMSVELRCLLMNNTLELGGDNAAIDKVALTSGLHRTRSA